MPMTSETVVIGSTSWCSTLRKIAAKREKLTRSSTQDNSVATMHEVPAAEKKLKEKMA